MPTTVDPQTSVSTRVMSIIRQVADEQGFELPDLHDDFPLHETGLDSLAFMVLQTRLEDEFGFDPFMSEDAVFPTTLGEFTEAYGRARARSLGA